MNVNKLLFEQPLKVTGVRLFWLLWAGVGATAFGLDWASGRSIYQPASLTLPCLICTLLVTLIGFWAIPWLQRLKAGQFIREDGPKAHLKKAGTPTMGGIFVVPVGCLAALLLTGFSANTLAITGLTLAYGLIGWLDDWKILLRQSNKGLSPRQKLALQILFGSLFCVWLFFSQFNDLTTLLLPFGLTLPLGLAFWALAGFVLVAESNATNLTDGLDGLASGVGTIALLGMGAIVATDHPDLMIFCACMSGSYLGFLVHNRNPAAVFMGDTGSLALGGALAGVAIMGNTLWALPVLGGLFLAETLSVVAQVSYYKATKGPDGVGKRLFRMAPLHHHLELSGWAETKVVGIFYVLTGALTILTLVLKAI